MASSIIIILANILGILMFASLILSIWRGAPPVPSNKRTIQIFLRIAAEYRPKKAVDLGAGHGKVVHALAQAEIEIQGYEINPALVWWGNMRLALAGLRHKSSMKTANLWQQNIESFDFVIIYGLPNVMHHFEAKLERELQPGALVVSNAFALPTWKPIQRIEHVYLYQKTAT